MTLQRRSFLKLASLAAAGSTAGLGPFGGLSALAQSAGGSDYKALVCILLSGGNDGNNMLIPGDTAGYAQYATARKSLALGRSSLLGLNSSTSLTLNPYMPEVQKLFQQNNVAIVANTGSLVAPLTRAEYLANSDLTPGSLFSHVDQTNFLEIEQAPSSSNTGWAGRVSDVLQSSYGTTELPTVVSVAGSTVFGRGTLTQGFSLVPGKANLGVGTCWESGYCSERESTAQQLLSMSSGAALVQSDGELTSQAYTYSANLSRAIGSASFAKLPFPASNPLSAQLQQIMQIMQIKSALGAKRQIFFATLPGFDNHANQLGSHNANLANLSAALGSFYACLGELGLASQVTTFTASDFGRALQGNSEAGSDHAWGSHHLVMGGAVKGGKIYGAYPNLTLGGPNDAGTNGRWIPTTSTTQYAATLASWFGVPATELKSVFPFISNFAQENLGFV